GLAHAPHDVDDRLELVEPLGGDGTPARAPRAHEQQRRVPRDARQERSVVPSSVRSSPPDATARAFPPASSYVLSAASEATSAQAGRLRRGRWFVPCPRRLSCPAPPCTAA